jgi:hypothetical protein
MNTIGSGLEHGAIMENVTSLIVNKDAEFAADGAVDYDGQAILALVRPEFAPGAEFSSATLRGEVANGICVALSSASFEEARAWKGAKVIQMPS